MDSIQKANLGKKNVLIVGATYECKTTDLATIKTIPLSRTFTVEDAGEFRLSEAELSKVLIVEN